MDGREAPLEEGSYVVVVTDRKGGWGFRSLFVVSAGNAADDGSSVVARVVPRPPGCRLDGTTAVASESNACVLVEDHAVIGKHLSKGVVGLVRNFGGTNKGDVIKVSKKSDPLPKVSGYTTLVTKNLPKSRNGLRKAKGKS